ncbi:uncharacterized protein F4812DRAFT_20277 [Daldinia caldariorum]|uniref:uncharacterized protein n=1 Tax=Daldinia caldariorum TaxID=326644 RepID=UPI002007C272|nr:uncharacterized protein F4812DRAFT_20277 [Daldinia caldariorum]KAI1472647.1 hypothetical protein F4812DRAFT_20277 [Daldinia caldariorum]
MSQFSAPREADMGQHLVIKARNLTLVTSSHTTTLLPHASSSLPLSPPVAESGDTTPREPVSRTVTTLDAQPGALAVGSSDSDHLENRSGMLYDGMQPAADQDAQVSLLSPGTAASPSPSRPSLSTPNASSTTAQKPHRERIVDAMVARGSTLLRWGWDFLTFDGLPNEILTHILSFLDVNDLLAMSRINHHFRTLSLHPILHTLRLRRARLSLPSLLTSPSRPTLAELISRHIFLTHTTQISRRLARSLVSIRLSRRLPLRPSAESLVQRGVLPPEAVQSSVAPGLIAKKRAVEKEKLKDGLRRWVGAVWRGEVRERSEGVRQWEERAGVGRVWRLRKFWERVGRDSDGVSGVG